MPATASTTSSTIRDRRRRAFTLSEVLIASTLGTMVLAGVLSTFLMLGRSGAGAVNYATMDAQVRRALEEFGQDVRMSSGIVWNSSSSVTLTVVDNYASTSNRVTYTWDNDSASATYRCFYRVPGDAAAVSPKTIFIRNVTTFAFARYDRLDQPASTDAGTKRIQLSMTAKPSTATTVAATDTVVSASFILRNKTAS